MKAHPLQTKKSPSSTYLMIYSYLLSLITLDHRIIVAKSFLLSPSIVPSLLSTSFNNPHHHHRNIKQQQQQQQQQQSLCRSSSSSSSIDTDSTNTPPSSKKATTTTTTTSLEQIFESFANTLQKKQSQIISLLETMDDKSNEKFSHDPWGSFASSSSSSTSTSSSSGGITRVIQNGNIIEKGAVSLTIIRNGTLSKDRAASITARRSNNSGSTTVVSEGDEYAAAALSLVLHSRSPMVPTFRSDARLFLVKKKKNREEEEEEPSSSLAWFGGGADLTPYYLYDEDIMGFHENYRQLCRENNMDYGAMKTMCDEYFYLPARGEHRGTGGIFFDDLMIDDDDNNSNDGNDVVKFVDDMMDLWIPSWMTIVTKRKDEEYTERQRQWQLLRRGRYLEFNLLYDRGVRFGLVGRNPRVEGVMVSAPPLIAWEYNHKIEEGSDEERLMKVLKEPRDWVS